MNLVRSYRNAYDRRSLSRFNYFLYHIDISKPHFVKAVAKLFHLLEKETFEDKYAEYRRITQRHTVSALLRALLHHREHYTSVRTLSALAVLGFDEKTFGKILSACHALIVKHRTRLMEDDVELSCIHCMMAKQPDILFNIRLLIETYLIEETGSLLLPAQRHLLTVIAHWLSKK